jgi:hypothetical protein
MRPGVPDVHITDSQDAELAAYHAVSGLAIVALVFGLLAPLSMIDPLLWILPVVGTVLGFVALRRIKKQSPALSGRGFAGIGLVVSVLFLVAGPTQWLTYRWQVRREALRFSEMYFANLADRKPEKAFQLALPPQQRQSLKNDEQLWGFYRNNQKMRQGLENFVKSPVIRTLLALGRERAMIRFYETIDQQSDEGNRDIVKERFAVTYTDEQDGEKKTFFLDVQLMRQELPDHSADWSVFPPELVTDGASIR